MFDCSSPFCRVLEVVRYQLVFVNRFLWTTYKKRARSTLRSIMEKNHDMCRKEFFVGRVERKYLKGINFVSNITHATYHVYVAVRICFASATIDPSILGHTAILRDRHRTARFQTPPVARQGLTNVYQIYRIPDSRYLREQ